MKNFHLYILTSFMLFNHIEAALPPLYQTASEIKAILEDKQLGQKLQSGDVIQKIEKNDQGYLITTQKNQIQVKVEYEMVQRPGPAPYTLHFDEPTHNLKLEDMLR